MSFFRRALCALAIAMAVPVCAAQAATFVVDRDDDTDVSACSSAANDCSLRGAINKANATAGADIIAFADNVRGVIKLNGTNLPLITEEVTLNGPGASALAIDGDGKSGIFETAPRSALALNDLTLRNASAPPNVFGGAIYNNTGSLTIRDCVLSGNRASAGGAICNAGGALVIERSTFSGNTATDFSGGAIYSTGLIRASDSTFSGNVVTDESTGIVTGKGGAIFSFYSFGGRFASIDLTNCTLSGNRANRGGAIYSGANSAVGIQLLATVTNCTITGNTALNGAGIASEGSFTVGNSIISGNSGTDVDNVPTDTTAGNFVSNGYNIIGTGTANFNKAGDQRNTDARLGPLADNGGPTQTIALLAGSPALDKGSTTLTTDQRGILRPQGQADDIGAYEAGDTPEELSFIVTTLADVVANDGQTSLREAINFANSRVAANTITFADDVRGKITLGARLPQLTRSVTIQGPGASNLAIDGGGKVRLLSIGSGVSANINGLTLSGALYDAAQGPEGAILNRGNLSLNYVALVGNTGIEGGAITNIDGTLALINTQVSGNTALSAGGALVNNNGIVYAVNSTISGNTVTSFIEGAGGGAISTFGEKASVELERVTLSGNSAAGNANRAGVWIESGTIALHNSILSGNGARDLQVDGGAVVSAGYNLIGQSSTNAGLVASDLRGVDPKLGALADNGGPTQTQALLTGSPAINSGDPAITDGFDQRGSDFPRVRGGRVDIGAFEVQAEVSSFTVSLSPQAPRTNDTLTVTSAQSLDGASYLWRRNGEVISGETESMLNLAKAGNGDKKDVISVEVKAGGKSATSSVVVINSVPVAISSQGSVDVDTEKGFPLLGFDADGDKLTYIRVGGPRNGVLADIRLGDDGITRLFYRSRPKYGGVDIIRFVVRDSDGKLSNESTLGISVNYTPPPPVNRAPVAGDTNIDTFVGKSEVKGLLGRDPDGDAITFRLVNNARFGKSEIRQDTDGLFKLFYTSLPKFYGPDRVTYIAIDTHGAQSNIATVNINFTNRKPVANGNKLTVASGEAVSQFLFGTDEDGDALTFRLVNNPQHGRGEIKRDEFGNWRVYYQSNLGYVGPDQITFIAIDPMGRESFAAAADINVVRVAGTPSVPDAVRAGDAPSGGGS